MIMLSCGNFIALFAEVIWAQVFWTSVLCDVCNYVYCNYLRHLPLLFLKQSWPVSQSFNQSNCAVYATASADWYPLDLFC